MRAQKNFTITMTLAMTAAHLPSFCLVSCELVRSMRLDLYESTKD